MRKNVILLLFFTLNLNYAQAEKLIFSNNNEEVDITGDVVIDNQSGDITVTPQNGNFVILEGDQPIILGFYPNNYETALNQSAGVSWVVANANSCTGTTVSGSSTWNGNKTAVDGKHPASPELVTFSDLPAKLRLVCSNGSESVTEEFTVSEESSVTTNPVINFFRVNGSSASNVNVSGLNATAVISWRATDVNNCAATSSPTMTGWNNANVGLTGTSPSLPIAQTTTVTLTCDNLPAKNIVINYSPGTDPSCASVTLPQLLTQQPEVTTYTTLNGAQPFGTSTGTNAIINFNINQYAQISGLSTSEVNFYRKLQFYPTPSGQNSPRINNISISECPGDFTSSANCVVPVSVAGFPQIRITTDPNANANTFCKIERNKDYYLNIIHDQFPFDSTPGECLFSSAQTCAVFFSELTDEP